MGPAEIRRLFASTPSDRQVLTINGLTFNYVHYRHNPDGTAELINNNHMFVPFAKRLQEDGRIEVPIRFWAFDLDMIEVLDETTGRYHPMWSTDPGYTGGLSQWEHRLYRKLLRLDDRGSARQKGRVSAKADQLSDLDRDMSQFALKQRGKLFALIDSEAHRRAMLEADEIDSRGHKPSAGDIRTWAAEPGEPDPQHPMRPPPQTRQRKEKATAEPPVRPRDYGTASTAELTRHGVNRALDEMRPGASPPSKFKPRRS